MPAGGFIKKVITGDSLVIPAGAYNDFVDAAQAHKNTTQGEGTGRQSKTALLPGHVWITTDSLVDQFGILAVDAPLSIPSEDLDGFRDLLVFQTKIPDPEIDATKVVIMQATTEAGGYYTMGMMSGVTPCKINITDSDHNFAVIEEVSFQRNKRLLSTGGSTSLQILWKPPNSIGSLWCIVKMGGSGGGAAGVFPVTLIRVSGAGGSATSRATWRYDVLDALTGDSLLLSQNPTSLPHRWVRQDGLMAFANFGYAHIAADGRVALGWINEEYVHSVCA